MNLIYLFYFMQSFCCNPLTAPKKRYPIRIYIAQPIQARLRLSMFMCWKMPSSCHTTRLFLHILYHPKLSLCHHTSRPFIAQGRTYFLASEAISFGPQTRMATGSSLDKRKASSMTFCRSGRLRFCDLSLPGRLRSGCSRLISTAGPADELSGWGLLLVSEAGAVTSPVRNSWTPASLRRVLPSVGGRTAHVASPAERIAQTSCMRAVGMSFCMAWYIGMENVAPTPPAMRRTRLMPEVMRCWYLDVMTPYGPSIARGTVIWLCDCCAFEAN